MLWQDTNVSEAHAAFILPQHYTASEPWRPRLKSHVVFPSYVHFLKQRVSPGFTLQTVWCSYVI